MGIEDKFDVAFVAKLTAEEKQIQQSYRPVIGVHKWFARRPGALFRSLVLSEFNGEDSLRDSYFRSHDIEGVTIGDPFMGGGTTLFESNRVGCNVVGCDINPMAYWVVRQELAPVDREALRSEAGRVLEDVAEEIARFYETRCLECGDMAQVKYYLWVKTHSCGGCAAPIDLFPGYLVAENSRHTHFVFHCPGCRNLVELDERPPRGSQAVCPCCSESFDWANGPARRNRYTCGDCAHVGRYPQEMSEEGPPKHRLFGMEYHCGACKPGRKGRFFKTAEDEDLARYTEAAAVFAEATLDIPDEEIPDGDETKRLHRWGYGRYREMFNDRQLLGLGLLMRRIRDVHDEEVRHALATVFSDFLRYQNMLCRYDTYALKCQDIFSVHGFPVGLVQCENNVLGIPRVGSGSFCHFMEKYDRAKQYCAAPFETLRHGRARKERIPMTGEKIAAKFVSSPKKLQGSRQAAISAGSFVDLGLRKNSLDGVFTDPPYFDNVQYAELMDFCFVWLRKILNGDVQEFGVASTRTEKELTGNTTTGKGLEHFTAGLSAVFSAAADALKVAGPFAFTYHHNDLDAYVPVVVAILDARLSCTATLPAPAEMTASLHISGTISSIVDTVIVCRKGADIVPQRVGEAPLREWLSADRNGLARGGVKATKGDLLCLALGHLARVVVSSLGPSWKRSKPTSDKMAAAADALRALYVEADVPSVVDRLLEADAPEPDPLPPAEVAQSRVSNQLRNSGGGKGLASRRK